MRRLGIVLLTAAGSLLVSTQASAATLTFDDISAAALGTIPDGYGGFDWTSGGFIDGDDIFATSGYANGAVSGEYVGYNEFEDPLTITGPAFDFVSVYLTAAWNNGLTVRVSGYLGAALLYQQSVLVSTGGPTLFNFNYLGIDRLVFESSGGTNAGLTGLGTHFAMDNFEYNADTTVPEPATLMLVGFGAAGLAARARRRQTRRS